MALWRPETTIYLCTNTGIDQYNKPYFESNAAMQGWLAGKVKASFTQYSYQRADERQYCRVEYNYNDALTCDIIMWQNTGTGPRWIIANITGVEVDAFCTYCGDINWAASYSLVEREHVTNDWKGANPNWINIGIPEGMGGTPDQVVYDQIKAYAPDTFVVFTPYDSSGQPMFGGAVENNVFNGLTMRTFSSAGAVNSYLQSVAESSEGKLENILGVYSVPGDFLSELSEAVETIPPWQSGGAIGPDLCRNAKCYSSEFCVAQVEGMNCETVTYKPELITTEGTFNFHIYGRFIGGGGGIIATPDAYDYMGNPGEYGCAITVFPQGAWVGNQYAQYQQTNKVNILATTAKSAGSFILAGAAAATGVGMAAVPGLVASGLSSAASIWDADTKAKKGSAAVNGSVSSDPILAAAIGQFGFKFRWYMCNELTAFSTATATRS